MSSSSLCLRSVLSLQLFPHKIMPIGVLRSFDYHTARDIAINTLRFFNSAFYAIPSTAHLDWILECLGYVFALHLNDIEHINAAKDIYLNWIIGRAPKVIDTQKYFHILLCHISLVFEDKRYDKGTMLQKQADLCRSVLEYLLELPRLCADRLTQDNWESLIKVVVAIAADLIDINQDAVNIGNEIQETLFRTLLELWIKSKTKDKSLWNILAFYSSLWKYREVYVHYLFHVRRVLTIGLADAVTANNQDIVLDIKWSEQHKSQIYVSPLDLVYMWHQFMMLSDDNISDPKILLFCVNSYVEFVSILNAGQSRMKSNLLSSSRSMLRVFGRFLFNISYLETQGFELCRAGALGALCQIFCNSEVDEFNEYETTRFFDTLILALSDSTDKVTVVEIIMNCSNIFSSSLIGSRILIPSIMPHIKKIFDKNASSLLIRARSSALAILGSLISIKSSFSSSENFKLLSINLHHLQALSSLLCNIISLEKDQSILISALRYSVIYLHENYSNYADANSLTSVIWNTLNENRWPTTVSLSALRCLANMTSIFQGDESISNYNLSKLLKYIQRCLDKSATSSETHTNPYSDILLAAEALQSLYIQISVIPAVMKNSKFALEIIKCVFSGFENSSRDFKPIHVQCDKILHFFLFDLGRNLDKMNYKSEADRFIELNESTLIKLAQDSGFLSYSENCDDFLHNSLLRIFWYKDTSLFSVAQMPTSFIDPVEASQNIYLLSQRRTKDYIRERWINGMINKRMHGSSLLLIRNLGGKFLWEASIVLLPRAVESLEKEVSSYNYDEITANLAHGYKRADLVQIALQDSVKSFSMSNNLYHSKNILHSFELLDRWKTSLAEANMKVLRKLQSKLESAEFDFFASKIEKNIRKMQIATAPIYGAVHRESNLYRFRDLRPLLINLGMVFPDPSSLKFRLISRGPDFNLRILQLDELSTRDVFSISVFFRKHGQNDFESILYCRETNSEFESFVSNLGQFVNLKDTKSFSADLTYHDIDSIPYFGCDEFQMLFIVSPLLKCAFSRARLLLQRNPVHLIWCEDKLVSNASEIRQQFSTFQKKSPKDEIGYPLVYIFIVPQDNNLFRIEIVDNHCSFYDNSKKMKHDDFKNECNDDLSSAVVSGSALCNLLRKTCASYLKKIVNRSDARVFPRVQRDHYINMLANRHVLNLSGSALYRSLFQMNGSLRK